MENQEKPHKRRVRYSGTHPKRSVKNIKSISRKNMQMW